MKKHTRILAIVGAAIVVIGLAFALSGWTPLALLGYMMNTVRSAANPAGSLSVDVRSDPPVARPVVTSTPGSGDANSVASDAGNWPSYNRTVTSARFSPLSEINTQTVGSLKILCTYDTKLRESFETGPIVMNGALIGTTALDTFSIDPSNCHENWRVHEEYKIAGLKVNRGAAYLDGRVFRGFLDGQVRAYDFKSGRVLWKTVIADPARAELVDAAPIAWQGLVFVGIALGDVKGFKGRMYALAADSGRVVWETYLVPKAEGDPSRGPAGTMPASAVTTWKNAPDVPISGGGTWTSYTLDPFTGRLYVPVGNPSPDFVPSLREGNDLYTNSVVVLDARSGSYINHFQIAPRDWHDWDVSNTPALIQTRGGKQLLTFTPKNGILYGLNLATGQFIYQSAVTRRENSETPLTTGSSTHFCPGAVGGGEWNGVAYDAQTNLVFSGEDDWCTTVKLQSDDKVRTVPTGVPWMGHVQDAPLDLFGHQDPHSQWAGWLYATDADTGQWKWRLKTNYPILGGITATAGRLVLFGDMGGNFYAVDASNGQRLWNTKLDGAIGGGMVTYSAGGSQKVAVAAGLTSILWPTEQATAKIVILGLR
jgi:alcohol dehydrogenase (cytochrome c)